MSALWDEEKEEQESEASLLEDDLMTDLLDLRSHRQGNTEESLWKDQETLSERVSSHPLFFKRFVRHVEEGHSVASHLDELHERLVKMSLKDNDPHVSLYEMLKDVQARIQKGSYRCSQGQAKHVSTFISQVLVKHHELCPVCHLFLKDVLRTLNRHQLI